MKFINRNTFNIHTFKCNSFNAMENYKKYKAEGVLDLIGQIILEINWWTNGKVAHHEIDNFLANRTDIIDEEIQFIKEEMK